VSPAVILIAKLEVITGTAMVLPPAAVNAIFKAFTTSVALAP